MSDTVAVAVSRAIESLKGYGPEPLLDEVNHRLVKSGAEQIDEATLVDAVTDPDPNDPVRIAFHIALSRWDMVDEADWADGADGTPTLAGTPERRDRVLMALALSTGATQRVDDTFPMHGNDTIVIAEHSEQWTPWYTDEKANARHFYWDAYRGVLERKLKDPYAVDRLDYATTEVVKRLADPSGPAPYQSKGLVVGHVQSGKTANFTGVIAKAVDAGYRLIIVLTGTVELLRSQTQRRLDAELVGRENILGGIDPDDADLIRTVDYAGTGDRDWLAGRFVSFGVRPRDVGVSEVRRLSTLDFDYKALKAGLSTLDFAAGNELKDPHRPLWHEVNLHGTDIRLAIVKKNKAVLTKLVSDLKMLHTKLGDIPTLIIDDEADQASVNTVNPKKSTAEQTERSAINKLIAQLLGQLKRAQYVGYTATPFANVFVNPDDVEDIYPRDFIISLEPPDGYMGGRDFHDLDGVDEEADYATSNEKAYVRDLRADPDDEAARRAEIGKALDAFVLAGAIKLWRANRLGTPGRFAHHTMLVHESVKQSEHDALAALVLDVLRRGSYSAPDGLRRLHDLWRDDFLPVSEARADGEPVPSDWLELQPFIGAALDKIHDGTSPVVVINGNKESDYAQPDLDFQARDVWKVLVGGTKLSRGFTVEGLTTTYYTRRTMSADTLMQMGRWFGYRAGYRDLVRLFIGREVAAPGGKSVDLYEAFETIVRDEEDFRSELRAFQGLDDDGVPKVRPIDVPPMVFQTLPWLKPTQAQKMYNAVLTSKGAGGRMMDFSAQPDRSAAVNAAHFKAVEPLLDLLTDTGTFVSDLGGEWAGRYGIVTPDEVRGALSDFRWSEGFDFGPALQFMAQAEAEGTLKDWFVVLPEISTAAFRTVGGRARIPLIRRKRRGSRAGFSGSSRRQRDALEVVAGGMDPSAPTLSATLRAAYARHPLAAQLHTPTRGSVLLTFGADPASGDSDPAHLPDPAPTQDVATIFSLVFPKLSAPKGRIGFAVQVKGAGVTVTASEVAEARGADATQSEMS